MSNLLKAAELTRYFDIGRNQRVHAVEKVTLEVAEKEIVGQIGV